MKTLNKFLEQAEPAQEPKKEDPKLKQDQKKENMLKKRVLMTKIRAVRGGATGIMASHEPDGELVEGVMKMIKSVTRKKKEKTAEKAMDAGARAKRKLARKVHAKYVSGSEDNVPDDIREEEVVDEGKKKGLWDNIHAKRKRGEKPAKPGDKDYPKTLNVEGAAWTKKAGKNPEGGLNEKGRKSYERENPGSDLKAPQPEGGSRKKSFCARMKGMRKRQKPSNNTGKDRLSLSLKKWKCNEEKISAFDFVKKKIEKEVGKSGYVSKDNPRKPQSAADKAKVRAHQAKVDKENAAARAKDPSQGRYPKG